MKQLTAQFKKIRTLFSRRKRATTGDYMNPLRDWTIGLCIATFTFLAGTAFIAYDFYTQFGVQTVTSDVAAQNNKLMYPKAEIFNLADSYREKESYFEKLRNARKAPLTPPQATEASQNETGEAPLAEEEGEQYTTPVPSSP